MTVSIHGDRSARRRPGDAIRKFNIDAITSERRARLAVCRCSWRSMAACPRFSSSSNAVDSAVMQQSRRGASTARAHSLTYGCHCTQDYWLLILVGQLLYFSQVFSQSAVLGSSIICTFIRAID